MHKRIVFHAGSEQVELFFAAAETNCQFA